MRRLTISIDDDLAAAFEKIFRRRKYQNRSEAFRDLLRQDLGAAQLDAHPEGDCVATLTYLYNHHERQLALRLTDMQHEHHEITVSAMHAHLDHDHCIETVILRGRTDRVQSFARTVIAQPGVSHGQLHLVPVQVHTHHGHSHVEPAAAASRRRRKPNTTSSRPSTRPSR